MELTISHNPLRMLAKTFMAAIPIKVIKQQLPDGIQKDHKYTIRHPQYGAMGVVECLSTASQPLMDIKSSVGYMVQGDANLASDLRTDHKLMNADAVQIVIFRFVRRYDKPFQDMIIAETKRAGLDLTFHQPTLNFQ